MSKHALFTSNAARKLLAEGGLTDLDAAFEVGQSLDELHQDRATRHTHKQVVRLEIPGRATTVYIKRQWRRERLLPRPTDLRHRINIKCSPIHEWRGLCILRDAGFDVAEPLALFWQGHGFRRGAIATRAVPPRYSIADLLQTGALDAMHETRVTSLVSAAAELIGRLQRARISWRSMKAKHFYPEELAAGRWRIWLIDCEGVYDRASRRDCQREWSEFLRYFTSRAPRLHAALTSAYRAAA